MNFKSLIFLSLVVLCAAQEGEQPVAGSEEIDPAILEQLQQQLLAQSKPTFLEGVSTFATFPGVHDGKFALGDVHVQVVGIKNHAETTINVTAIMGHLTSPFDLNYFIQNFTKMDVGITVAPGESISLAYRYAPYTSLDPMAYHLLTQLAYHTVEEAYTVSLHNATIELYEKPSGFETTKVLSFVVTIGSALVGSVLLFRYIRGTSSLIPQLPARKTFSKEATAQKGVSTKSWLPRAEAASVRNSASRKSK